MSSPGFPTRRILVVDDEPLVCEAVRILLSFDGHEVFVAKNAREALDLYATNEFDVVITDYAMPGMTGDKLAVAIKERSPEQPIIMITAFAEVLPNPVAGIDHLISKPFLLENLREAISKVMAPKEAKA